MQVAPMHRAIDRAELSGGLLERNVIQQFLNWIPAKLTDSKSSWIVPGSEFSLEFTKYVFYAIAATDFLSYNDVIGTVDQKLSLF